MPGRGKSLEWSGQDDVPGVMKQRRKHPRKRGGRANEAKTVGGGEGSAQTWRYYRRKWNDVGPQGSQMMLVGAFKKLKGR